MWNMSPNDTKGMKRMNWGLRALVGATAVGALAFLGLPAHADGTSMSGTSMSGVFNGSDSVYSGTTGDLELVGSYHGQPVRGTYYCGLGADHWRTHTIECHLSATGLGTPPPLIEGTGTEEGGNNPTVYTATVLDGETMVCAIAQYPPHPRNVLGDPWIAQGPCTIEP